MGAALIAVCRQSKEDMELDQDQTLFSMFAEHEFFSENFGALTKRHQRRLTKLGCKHCKLTDGDQVGPNKLDSARDANQQEELGMGIEQRNRMLLRELFALQDLNSDGVLDETELVMLNERIAVLHYGSNVDRAALRAKYSALFRAHLDADGRPIAFQKFSQYMMEVLHAVDPDPFAQEMILEQFILEAAAAREMMHYTSVGHLVMSEDDTNIPCERMQIHDPHVGDPLDIMHPSRHLIMPSVPLSTQNQNLMEFVPKQVNVM